MHRPRRPRAQLRVLWYGLAVLAFVVLASLHPIIAFVKHMLLAYEMAAEGKAHGHLEHMLGALSPLGIDNQLEYQYRMTIHHLCPLWPPVGRWVLGAAGIALVCAGALRRPFRRVALWVPLLGTLVLLLVYVHVQSDYYLFYKTLALSVPLVALAAAGGTQALLRRRIARNVASGVLALLFATTAYNWLVSTYHYARYQPLLLDHEVLEAIEQTRNAATNGVPLVAYLSYRNRSYWLLQGIGDLNTMVPQRSNPNRVNPGDAPLALVEHKMTNDTTSWWVDPTRYRDLWVGHSYSLRAHNTHPLLQFVEQFDDEMHKDWYLAPGIERVGDMLVMRRTNEPVVAQIKLDGLRSNTWYRLAFRARAQGARSTGWVMADLFGDGYDSPRQELMVKRGDITSEWSEHVRTLNSETFPATVTLRLASGSRVPIEIDWVVLVELAAEPDATPSLTVSPAQAQQ